MSLLTDNYNSPIIRSYYSDRRKQAYAYLMTVGAKALVLEEQKSQGKLIIYKNGINEEAEMRKKMIEQEKVRSVKRKLFEQEGLYLIKYSRKKKLRLIKIVIQHSQDNITNLLWFSTYRYIKRFLVDTNIRITLLPSFSAVFSTQCCYIDCNATTKNSQILPLSLTPTDAINTNIKDIIGVQLKNRTRTIDCYFFNVVELEAFLLVLKRYANVNFSDLHTLIEVESHARLVES
jgi:hypothetical protein